MTVGSRKPPLRTAFRRTVQQPRIAPSETEDPVAKHALVVSQVRDDILEHPLIRCVGNAFDSSIINAREQREYVLRLGRERLERVLTGYVRYVRGGVVGELTRKWSPTPNVRR